MGLDQAMSIGLRGPSNLFGHPDDKSLEDLDTVLSEWDNFTAGTVTKHVFGHFPTSFTAATEAGGRLEGILAKHSISAYVCGHLHAKFGKHLYKHHRVVLRSHEYSLQGPSAAEFWEWEMGDWRQSRLVRVMAIDQGRTSFTDFRLYGGTNFSDPENIQLPTVIIPTFPLDSRFMLTKSHGASRQESTIRALIFSPDPQFSVYVKILDTKASTVLTIYEQPMLRVPGYADGPLFQASWEPQKFSGASPTRYWLQITVNSSSNTILASDTRPFSVHNKDAGYRYTWMEFLVMGFRWESFSMLVLLATLLAILLGIIIIPKVISTWAQRVDIYSKFVPSVSDSFCISTIAKAPLWVLMEGAQNSSLWWSETALLVYLVLFPWFWGLPLAEGYPVGFMSMWGWTIAPSWTKPAHGNVGAPDNMNIVLPFLCTVFLPCLLISAALSAEQAAYEKLPRTVPQHHCDASEDSGNVVSVTRRACKAKPTVLGFQRLSGLEYAADNEMNTEAKGKVVIPGAKVATSKRPMRKLLLVGCLLVFYLHAKVSTILSWLKNAKVHSCIFSSCVSLRAELTLTLSTDVRVHGFVLRSASRTSLSRLGVVCTAVANHSNLDDIFYEALTSQLVKQIACDGHPYCTQHFND